MSLTLLLLLTIFSAVLIGALLAILSHALSYLVWVGGMQEFKACCPFSVSHNVNWQGLHD